METAPSEAFEGAAEEIVEVNNDKEIVGNLDANTIVKVVMGQDVTIPSEEKSKLSSSSW